MFKIFSVKTILTTILSTSIASSLMALPVRANQVSFTNQSSNYELSYSQRNSGYNNRPTFSQPTNNFKQFVGIAFLALGTGVITWHLTRAQNPSLEKSLQPVQQQHLSLLGQVSPKLRHRLLRLVHNQHIANRLLFGTLTSHPGRSPDWLAEKVIYDLQRDRA